MHLVPARHAHAPLVLEREREIAALDDLLTRALNGAGSTIVIEGEAGIGKSTLVRHVVAAAAARGIRALRAQGGELERDLPYGIVAELFRALARDTTAIGRHLTGPARIAAPLLGMQAEPAESAPSDAARAVDRTDPVAYVHGLFWLVLNLAEEGPLAIVVDDAQWADEPSLRFLHHLARRIEDLPVALVLAMRPDEAGTSGPGAAALRAERAATHILPEALSEPAVGQLVGKLAGRPIGEELRRAAWEATDGNPFFVTELASALAGSADLGPEALAQTLPEGVGRYVEARLTSGPPDARRLAEAVALLGESATLHRAAAIAQVDPANVDAAARWLVDAAILADAEPLEFRHPILRGSVDASIPAPTRVELHRRAALLLAGEGVAIAVVGTHLRNAAARGDSAVVDLLLLAADDASGRGEPKTAVALLRRALEEPPLPTRRLDVLTALARAEAAASALTAPETYAEAIALSPEGDSRAALRLELGSALLASGQWPAAFEAFSAGLDELVEGPGELRAHLEAGYLSAGWVTMADRGRIGERVRQILEARDLGEANRQLAAWIGFQQGAVVESSAADMGALVRRVFAEAPIERLVREGQTVEVGVGLLLETDDLELEHDILSRAIDVARRTGPISKAGMYAYCRAWPAYYMGRLTDAIADGEEALRAAELGWEAFVPAALTVVAEAYIERDELDAAAALLDVDRPKWAGRIDAAMLLPLADGRLALARGDLDEAERHLRLAKDGAGTAFMRNSIPTEWRTWLATTLWRLDRRDEARALAEENVEVARQWGARWPLGAALRVLGLVRGGAAGIEALREGRELLAESPAQLEHARLLVTLGATLRRNGSLTEAREVLTRAADLAQRLGARALLRRASDELRAAGARRRRLALTGVDALTPSELRVATEALAGRTNREIAQALFVTPKAVEFHLANTYRKLGITSRAELAAAMERQAAA